MSTSGLSRQKPKAWAFLRGTESNPHKPNSCSSERPPDSDLWDNLRLGRDVFVSIQRPCSQWKCGQFSLTSSISAFPFSVFPCLLCTACSWIPYQANWVCLRRLKVCKRSLKHAAFKNLGGDPLSTLPTSPAVSNNLSQQWLMPSSLLV